MQQNWVCTCKTSITGDTQSYLPLKSVLNQFLSQTISSLDRVTGSVLLLPEVSYVHTLTHCISFTLSLFISTLSSSKYLTILFTISISCCNNTKDSDSVSVVVYRSLICRYFNCMRTWFLTSRNYWIELGCPSLFTWFVWQLHHCWWPGFECWLRTTLWCWVHTEIFLHGGRGQRWDIQRESVSWRKWQNTGVSSC